MAVALAAGGLVLLAVGSAFVLTSDHEDNKAAFLSLALTVGLSFLVSGLIALWRRPDNRTGFLLVAVSYFWCLGGLTLSNNDSIFTLGLLVNPLALGAFVHLLLAFPDGRLQGRRDAWLVAATYIVVLVGTLAQLLVEEHPDQNCAECSSTIAVTDSDTASTVAGAIVGLLGLALVVAVLVIVVARFLRARGALRRALGPVLGTGAIVLLVLLLELVAGSCRSRRDAALLRLPRHLRDRAGRVPRGHPPQPAGPLERRRPPARAVARDADPRRAQRGAEGSDPRDRLLAAGLGPLRDLGRQAAARRRPERAVTLVEYAGRPTAALLHDATLADEPSWSTQSPPAAGLWLENDRLQAQLRAQVEFLETTVNTSPLAALLARPGGADREPEPRGGAGERVLGPGGRALAAVLGRLRGAGRSDESARPSALPRPFTRRRASSTRS